MTDTRTTPNVPRLRELARWAREEDDKRLRGEPSEWYQGYWFSRDPDELEEAGVILPAGCGTACCIAGKQAQLEGAVPYFNPTFDTTSGGSVLVYGDRIDVDEFACETLGITKDEADRLFEASNDIDRIEYVINDIITRATDEK